tara:strand:+ start:1865 stop:2809 length:945 start_codon:yes stop_codon:yes gene_type:complete
MTANQTENETYIERPKHFFLEGARLTLYETNTPANDVVFNPDKFVLALMLTGRKTVDSDNLNFEFLPGTIFIPEKKKQKFHIQHASNYNSTKCLVLDIYPEFLKAFTDTLAFADQQFIEAQKALNKNLNTKYFMSTDKQIIDCLTRIYTYQLNKTEYGNDIVTSMALKELIIRLYQTDALYFLLDIFSDQRYTKEINRTIKYIKQNLTQAIEINDLMKVSGMGKTSLFEKFKKHVGVTPVQYILKERIAKAKNMIPYSDNLKNIAFETGFNSYEYFSKSFAKVEGCTPSEYKIYIKTAAKPEFIHSKMVFNTFL